MMSKKILILLGLLLPSLVFGGVIVYSQNFDLLNNGDLVGQDNWTGDVGFNIQTAIKQAGAKGLENTNTWISKAYRDFSPTSQIKSTIYLRISDTNGYSSFSIRSGTADRSGVAFSFGVIEFYTGSGAITLDNSLIVNTWYKLEMEVKGDENLTRARVNDDVWTDWFATTGQPSLDLDNIKITSDGPSGIKYYDELMIEEIPPPPSYITIPASMPTNMLAYAGDLFTDLTQLVILAVGLPVGFVVIKKVISLVKLK